MPLYKNKTNPFLARPSEYGVQVRGVAFVQLYSISRGRDSSAHLLPLQHSQVSASARTGTPARHRVSH
jgi:hypothetical protein